MDLQSRLLEEIEILEHIQDKEDKVKIFKEVRETIQALHTETTLSKKELKFVLNSFRGLIDGFKVFTNEEILEEIQLILSKLSSIKEHLVNYTRNAIFKAPEGKYYLDLEPDHFIQLARLQGQNRVLKNLINLKWEDPNLTKWVDNIIAYVKSHKHELKKGSFKDQLEGLRSLGNLSISQTEKERGSLTTKTADFIHELASKPKQLIGDGKNWITAPVFINCFDKVILRKLKEIGYKLKIFGQYVILSEAKCYCFRKNKQTTLEAIKIMSPLIPKPFVPVGSPILYENHYCWLCFEFPLAINIKMWNFL